jgi:hypothetical protein
MIDLTNALEALRLDILKVAQLERDRLELLNSPLNPAMRDEQDRDLQNDIERRRARLTRVLTELISFPPYHRRHEQLLADFHSVANFDKSVFIMTKFPDPKKPAAITTQLATVIQAVRDAVTAAGYQPRVATDKPYHPILWDNVELYLLGCRRGIAIVEDKYLPELNPNVAMEWGWMRGMGRSVLYLVEKDFKSARADWSGLIENQFDWADPLTDIQASVTTWLKNAS